MKAHGSRIGLLFAYYHVIIIILYNKYYHVATIVIYRLEGRTKAHVNLL